MTQVNVPLLILTGSCTGIAEGLVIVPFELVKVRLQDASRSATNFGPVKCLTDIVKQEGLLGLYKGTESVLWRGIFFNGFLDLTS